MVVVVDLVLSVTDVAVSVTDALAGALVGAVYLTGAPLAEVETSNVPQAGEQAVEFCVRVQFRPWLAPSLETVDENC